MLARLLHLGFRVPSGFALTTELARHPEGLAGPEGIPPPVVARIRDQVARLERLAGRRLGDATSPLLLSVRGGAPVSMPGMLESFLNVGINETIAEGMAATPRYSWAAWDSYRRFLQFWGMSHGLGRHLFDELMSEAKQRHGVPKKALLEPLQMKEVAQRYRALLDDHGLRVIEEPFAQLLACIERVRRSWHSEHARLYRRALHIAEEWETAVLVQRMVFGNLDAGAGTGVLLTRHPQHESGSREPYGDFVVQGQGDDVVAGLVETHPITEGQRRREASHSPLSLERDFPAIYGELAAMARTLVQDHGMNHQEIEFTFESPRPEDLFILQTRDTVLASGSLVPAFEPTPELEAARIAAGVGVGGGALSGRAAHTADDVADAAQTPSGGRHHPPAPRHGPRRHPADAPRRRPAHVARRGDEPRRGRGEAGRQDLRRRLPAPPGVGAGGALADRRPRARDRGPPLDRRDGRLDLPRRASDRRGPRPRARPAVTTTTRKGRHERHRTGRGAGDQRSRPHREADASGTTSRAVTSSASSSTSVARWAPALEAVCGVIENDSTYGSIHRFLHGIDAAPCVRIADREAGLLDVAGVPVTVLRTARNPKDIDWRGQGVRLVVNTTGAFDDPTLTVDSPRGSLRGHLLAGAEKVIYSAAFKTRARGLSMPDDATTLIYGINHEAFDPAGTT